MKTAFEKLRFDPNHHIMTEAERIEKTAEGNADSFDRRGTSVHHGYRIGYVAGATAEHERLQQQLKKKTYHPEWYKIIDAILQPSKRPMCRDCADSNGTCDLNDGLPCDPTDEVIERFKRLTAELKAAQELLGDIQASWEQFGALTSDLEERINKAKSI